MHPAFLKAKMSQIMETLLWGAMDAEDYTYILRCSLPVEGLRLLLALYSPWLWGSVQRVSA